MRRIRNFIFRFKRGIGWFIFSFKQNPWNEDGELLQVIEKQLLDTAFYFEELEKKGAAVSINNCHHVGRMRLAAKLIRMYLDEYYWNEYTNAQKNENHRSDGTWKTLIGDGYWKDTYKVEDAIAAEVKDGRALEIGLNIISTNVGYWWI